MSEQQVDNGKRRFLIAATTAVGGVAGVAVLAPFVMSMMPSQRAKAAGAPVEIDISKIEPGMLLAVAWQGKPVWVVNRTKAMLASLPGNDSRLVDPKSLEDQQPPYAKNETRSVKPEYLVVVGICTHLGCSPTYRPELAPADLGPKWDGGWFCPCHGSKYDLSARVYKDVPAPLNMVIPPHHYMSDTRILVGEGPKGA
ncbi:ubiquinol-cytochrome c reductase iron-sulfur subunit [Sulfuriferula sp.]|jgi:ubiquinol-cytochrome c reductase iron-sulfur subunit|uniref:ubiquinol-cytochrome c reductase iron-sulfur subunit n=1 Tax=Sulfuriferula sp. TaxID=2025307 RepID=UPI002731064F|nr:ubiquinol-cytochrome c reductase iron-sulfur subunit [Sulfuriferula sp.]MDP2026689.1 ubiquinol-cytochrome c reductase iron-sulfur subunit [Sulfuriferula sp.]